MQMTETPRYIEGPVPQTEHHAFLYHMLDIMRNVVVAEHPSLHREAWLHIDGLLDLLNKLNHTGEFGADDAREALDLLNLEADGEF